MGMTADVYPFDASFLTLVAQRIVIEVRGMNRVTYVSMSKPPGTIERDWLGVIDYGSFLNRSWKMSWPQVRPRACSSAPPSLSFPR